MLKEKLKGFVVGVVLTSLAVGAIPTMAEKVTKSAELLYNNIKVVIDGKQADLKDAQGNTVEPFIIDGTTYLPVRAVSNALNKAVSWDGATQTVYLGKNEEIEQPSVWLKDLETFTGTVETKSIDEVEFGGYEYNNILTANTGDVFNNYWYPADNKVSYLVNCNYSKFKGTLYLNKIGKDYGYANRVVIYGDEKVIYTSDKIISGTKPINIDLDISNVSVLKILYQSTRATGEENWMDNVSVKDYHAIGGELRNDYTPIGNAGLYE